MFFRHIDQPWSSINTKYYHLWKCHNLWHTIIKVEFLSKNSILTKPQHFHEFFIQKFFGNFSRESKLSTAKKSKTKAFSRVFHPNKLTIFFGKSTLNFWTKNEDFEQCGWRSYLLFFKKDCWGVYLVDLELSKWTKSLFLSWLLLLPWHLRKTHLNWGPNLNVELTRKPTCP